MVRLAALAAMLLVAPALAGTLLRIDASAPVPAPLEGYVKMGAALAPNGDRLAINSRFLSRNGKPWLPVMGEFHYSRSPDAQWESELRKMKAAGIDIVASYVIWNHHEELEGQFDWKGNRDLRRFAALCAKAGLDLVVRIGPWAHAEVRYGGIPDWVVDSMPTRADDPQYLRYAERFYSQIGEQLKGRLWKDGGPVIGVQIENEYNQGGPGQGAGHIRTLKRLALKAGLDVPLYTVTGWDRAQYPSGEVTPVFGGYPDEPWATAASELAPKETYAFRFGSRVSGNLGAQTVGTGRGTADSDIDRTPFLGAEYGAGLPFMYRRRPVVSPDDIASMLPVQLGSGVNLLGYYMFHGGRNPVGRSTLEESTASGGHNDTNAISYDFQAPLGPDGQQRPVLARLRPYHLFLRDFGARLAPMTVRKPALAPASAADLATPRLSVRSEGERGFLFVNNHVRQYPMPVMRDVRFAVTLPHQQLEFPRQPVTLAESSYFIWPMNFDLDGATLSYATVQPVARIDAGADGIMYVFSATGGVAPELGFEPSLAPFLKADGARIEQDGGRLVVDQLTPGTGVALTIERPGARRVSVMILSPEQARELSIGELGGRRRLVLSAQQSYFEDGALQLRSLGDSHFRAAVYPPLPAGAPGASGSDGVFQVFEARQTPRVLNAGFTPLRPAQAAPAIAVGGHAKGALQPKPESWRTAAAWQLDLSGVRLEGLDDALLQVDFVGDIGRLFAGTRMLDDWYYSGYGWQVGLKQLGAGAPLTLSVLPLRADAPIYLPKEARPDFGGQAQLAQLRKVSVIPVYKWTIAPSKAAKTYIKY